MVDPVSQASSASGRCIQVANPSPAASGGGVGGGGFGSPPSGAWNQLHQVTLLFYPGRCTPSARTAPLRPLVDGPWQSANTLRNCPALSQTSTSSRTGSKM